MLTSFDADVKTAKIEFFKSYLKVSEHTVLCYYGEKDMERILISLRIRFPAGAATIQMC